MSQHDQAPSENSDPAKVRSDSVTEGPADFDMLSYLLASLPDRIGPERPLRLTPAARVSPLFLKYRREQKNGIRRVRARTTATAVSRNPRLWRRGADLCAAALLIFGKGVVIDRHNRIFSSVGWPKRAEL